MWDARGAGGERAGTRTLTSGMGSDTTILSSRKATGRGDPSCHGSVRELRSSDNINICFTQPDPIGGVNGGRYHSARM